MLNFLFTLQSVIAGRIERDDKGATAVEYGLMCALIAIAIILAVTAAGDALFAMFNTIATELGGTAATAP